MVDIIERIVDKAQDTRYKLKDEKTQDTSNKEQGASDKAGQETSSFEQFKPDYGKTIVCGYGRIDGWAVGIVANQRK